MKWLSSVTPRISRVMFSRGTGAPEGGARTGGCPKGTVSCWISGEKWPVASSLPTSPSWFSFASAFTMLGAEASKVKLLLDSRGGI